MGAFLAWDSQALLFDVVVSETHELSSEITEFPVEAGANIADHYRSQLDRVVLDVFISNAPLDGGTVQALPLDVQPYSPPLAPTPGALFTAAENAIGGALNDLLGKQPPRSFQAETDFGDKDFVAETLTILRKLRDDAKLIEVVTTEWRYENMVLEDVQLTRNADSGTGGEFTLSFRQIRIVESKIVSAPKPTEPRAQKLAPKGSKGTKEQPAPKQSILFTGNASNGNPLGL